MSSTTSTSRTPTPYRELAGPDTIDDELEQLAGYARSVDSTRVVTHVEHQHVEQLEPKAHPTKPTSSEKAHANDPSRTTTTQRRYAQKLRGRFDSIRAEINKAVRDRDELGLGGEGSAAGGPTSALLGGDALDEFRAAFYELLARQQYDAADELVEQLQSDWDADDLRGRDFDFSRDAEKHDAFMRWLRGQQENGVLDVIDDGENVYVDRAYERGVKNANSWSDAENPDPSINFALDRPVHRDKLDLLYQRNFQALRGITEEVDRQISRVLANGLAEGVGQKEIATRLNDRIDKIGKTRATTLARTETMYAHNEASITQYERINDSDVELQVKTEVSTAGDQHVCEICEPFDGRVFSTDDARSKGPPFHPRCRCVLIPATGNNKQAG